MVALANLDEREPQETKIPEVDFKPVRDFVLAKVIPPGETAGGIVIPESTNLGATMARIVAVGPGKPCDYDPEKIVPMCCKPGEIVYIGSFTLNPIPMILNGHKLILIYDHDIAGHHVPVKATRGSKANGDE